MREKRNCNENTMHICICIVCIFHILVIVGFFPSYYNYWDIDIVKFKKINPNNLSGLVAWNKEYRLWHNSLRKKYFKRIKQDAYGSYRSPEQQGQNLIQVFTKCNKTCLNKQACLYFYSQIILHALFNITLPSYQFHTNGPIFLWKT